MAALTAGLMAALTAKLYPALNAEVTPGLTPPLPTRVSDRDQGYQVVPGQGHQDSSTILSSKYVTAPEP